VEVEKEDGVEMEESIEAWWWRKRQEDEGKFVFSSCLWRCRKKVWTCRKK